MYKIPSNCQVDNLNELYIEYFGYPSEGYFVEVGAYDGELFSNTACLADIGWKGLYIEPIYDHYLKCLKRHDRNDVTVANVAIGLDEGEKIIYRGDLLTTLDKDQLKRYSEIEWSKNYNFVEETCDQLRLDTLMEKIEVPKNFDILVVDVEGKESEVFETFDLLDWKPKMMIIELEDDHESFQIYPDYVNIIRRLRTQIIDSGYKEVSKNRWNTVFVLDKNSNKKL
jgi:FkbM family methyltransferase